MVVKIYLSGISGNKEVKKKQQRVQMILDSKSVTYEAIDITEPGREKDKEHMQQNGKVREVLGKHPLPPQIFNEEIYCGDYEDFDLANETDELEAFLHIPIPSKLSSSDNTNDAKVNGSREDNDGRLDTSGQKTTEENGVEVELTSLSEEASLTTEDAKGGETAHDDAEPANDDDDGDDSETPAIKYDSETPANELANETNPAEPQTEPETEENSEGETSDEAEVETEAIVQTQEALSEAKEASNRETAFTDSVAEEAGDSTLGNKCPTDVVRKTINETKFSVASENRGDNVGVETLSKKQEPNEALAGIITSVKTIETKASHTDAESDKLNSKSVSPTSGSTQDNKELREEKEVGTETKLTLDKVTPGEIGVKHINQEHVIVELENRTASKEDIVDLKKPFIIEHLEGNSNLSKERAVTSAASGIVDDFKPSRFPGALSSVETNLVGKISPSLLKSSPIGGDKDFDVASLDAGVAGGTVNLSVAKERSSQVEEDSIIDKVDSSSQISNPVGFGSTSKEIEITNKYTVIEDKVNSERKEEFPEDNLSSPLRSTSVVGNTFLLKSGQIEVGSSTKTINSAEETSIIDIETRDPLLADNQGSQVKRTVLKTTDFEHPSLSESGHIEITISQNNTILANKGSNIDVLLSSATREPSLADKSRNDVRDDPITENIDAAHPGLMTSDVIIIAKSSESTESIKENLTVESFAAGLNTGAKGSLIADILNSQAEGDSIVKNIDISYPASLSAPKDNELSSFDKMNRKMEYHYQTSYTPASSTSSSSRPQGLNRERLSSVPELSEATKPYESTEGSDRAEFNKSLSEQNKAIAEEHEETLRESILTPPECTVENAANVSIEEKSPAVVQHGVPGNDQGGHEITSGVTENVNAKHTIKANAIPAAIELRSDEINVSHDEDTSRTKHSGISTVDLLAEERSSKFDIDKIEYSPQLQHVLKTTENNDDDDKGVFIKSWNRRASEADLVNHVRSLLNVRDAKVASRRGRDARSPDPQAEFLNQINCLVSDVEIEEEEVSWPVVTPPKEPTPPPAEPAKPLHPQSAFLLEVLRVLNSPAPRSKKVKSKESQQESSFLNDVKSLLNSEEQAFDGRSVYFVKEKATAHEDSAFVNKVRVLLDEKEKEFEVNKPYQEEFVEKDHSNFLSDVFVMLNDQPMSEAAMEFVGELHAFDDDDDDDDDDEGHYEEVETNQSMKTVNLKNVTQTKFEEEISLEDVADKLKDNKTEACNILSKIEDINVEPAKIVESDVDCVLKNSSDTEKQTVPKMVPEIEINVGSVVFVNTDGKRSAMHLVINSRRKDYTLQVKCFQAEPVDVEKELNIAELVAVDGDKVEKVIAKVVVTPSHA